jgi:DNA-binding response OmpR family regulator
MKANSREKILLVEDDPFISEIYYRKLTESDFEVKLAQDGLTAIDLFIEFEPDLVILDIMLPKKSGWEVLKEIKSNYPEKSKIIMLTNLSDKEKIEQAKKMGVDDYLIKASLTPTELVEIIKDKLSKK